MRGRWSGKSKYFFLFQFKVIIPLEAVTRCIEVVLNIYRPMIIHFTVISFSNLCRKKLNVHPSLSVRPSIHRSACLLDHLCVCPSVRPSFLPCVHRSVRPFIAPSSRPSTGPLSYSSNLSFTNAKLHISISSVTHKSPRQLSTGNVFLLT